ncbi:MAG: DUF2851 family protein [Bacteroidota bacterium]
MNESFLYYVWQLQYFTKKDLRTTAGERIEIFKPGILNKDSGPDFSNAKIKIGNLDWVGTVEIHVKASAWKEHHHDTDAAYDSVILHVVWENDKPVLRADNTMMPTLELLPLVEKSLLVAYKKLINSPTSIPCEKLFSTVNELVKISMLDRALMQRLELKAAQVIQLFNHNQNDWEEITYQLLARNFGFKVNYEPFFRLSHAVPYKVLLKHGDNLLQMESLLFGQAGFIDHALKDEYMKNLQREYQMLSKKYKLENMQLNKSVWKYLRLRPANFPTLRIAQFSALFFQRQNLFSQLVESENLQDLKSIFNVTPSEYWDHHYRFGHKTVRSLAGLGESSIDNLVINTVTPLLVAYGKQKDDQSFVDRAVNFLQHIQPESNKITKVWAEVGLPAKSAFDSQGLIELNNNYCLKRRCLSCTIGSSILKPFA